MGLNFTIVGFYKECFHFTVQPQGIAKFSLELKLIEPFVRTKGL